MNHLMRERCTIMQVDQAEGQNIPYILNLRCSPTYAYPFRQTRAETAYDFTPAFAYSEVPTTGEIEEGMRLVFDTGEDYRIHAVNGWPHVVPQYMELVLQGEGHG